MIQFHADKELATRLGSDREGDTMGSIIKVVTGLAMYGLGALGGLILFVGLLALLPDNPLDIARSSQFLIPRGLAIWLTCWTFASILDELMGIRIALESR